jgi:tetratricopeptide (TPR) repeat protein
VTVADSRIDELRRRLEHDPASRLFAQLAEEHRKAGELEEAIRVARAGLAQHPNYPSARLTLGRALLESGDAGSARVELEAALRGAPDNILAGRFLGEALEALGDLGSALVQYRATLKVAPGDRHIEGRIRGIEIRLGAPGAAGPARGTRAGGGPAATSPRAPAGPSRPTEEAEEDLPATIRIRAGGPPPAPPPLPTTLRIPALAGPPPQAPTLPPPEAAAGPLDESDQAPTLPTAHPPDLVPLEEPLPPTLPPRPLAQEPAPQRESLPGLAGDSPAGPAFEGPPLIAFEAGAAEAGDLAGAPFSSSTLAELYYRQGFVERAKEVYERLLQGEPGNEKARARLMELRGRAAPSEPAESRAARRRALERTIAALEKLLAAVRRR